MEKYKVLICREVWGYVEVEAKSVWDAQRAALDGDYEGEFMPTGKIGNECVYRAELVKE